jgi:hypothetical protein
MDIPMMARMEQWISKELKAFGQHFDLSWLPLSTLSK